MKKNITKTKNYKEAVETRLFFMRIGDSIFKARNQKELSQGELAKGAKTTQRIISLIENADNYNLGGDLFYRIFKFLNKKMIVDNYDMISGIEVDAEMCNNELEKSAMQLNYTSDHTCAFHYNIKSATHNSLLEPSFIK